MALNISRQVLEAVNGQLLDMIAGMKGTEEPRVAIDPFKVLAARAEPTSHLLIARNASSRVRTFDNPVYAVAWMLLAGPQEDGVTANVGNIFFGGEEVSLASGIRIVPGGQLDSSSFPQVPLFDLSRFYFHIINASDTVRLAFWS